MPSSRDQRPKNEREQPYNYELKGFVKDLEDSFGCNRGTPSSLLIRYSLLMKVRKYRHTEHQPCLHQELCLYIGLDGTAVQTRHRGRYCGR
jgi:hypothetical protein